MDISAFEKELWFEVFERVCNILEKNLRDISDWPKVKAMIAEVLTDIILRVFKTVKFIALAELSGGEYVEDYEGGFDIDLLVEVGSRAEAYALKNLEPLFDNAIREAIVYTKDKAFLRKMGEKYGKGIYHNVLELHVNNAYVEALKNSSYYPITVLYRRPTNCIAI